MVNGDSNHSYDLELNRAPFHWELDTGKLNFFNLPSALFWLNPSMLHMLNPLAEEIGIPLFRLLVASSSSLGTYENYHAMVMSLGNSFEEGFLAWGRAVSAAGWGMFELPAIDYEAKTATVIVRNPWELQMQQGLPEHWGCPFMQGKIIGIFSHAFGVTCWADEQVVFDPSGAFCTFQVYASERTIQAEIMALRHARQQAAQEELERKSSDLIRAEQDRTQLQDQIIRMQAAMLAELSTPLIPLNDNVLLMPLIGTVDSKRAQQVIETLLQGAATHHAGAVILDISGMPLVDTSVANVLVQAAQAVRLLGSEVVLTGIRPEIAQTLVGLGVELNGIVTRGTLQSGIDYAISRYGTKHSNRSSHGIR